MRDFNADPKEIFKAVMSYHSRRVHDCHQPAPYSENGATVSYGGTRTVTGALFPLGDYDFLAIVALPIGMVRQSNYLLHFRFNTDRHEWELLLTVGRLNATITRITLDVALEFFRSMN